MSFTCPLCEETQDTKIEFKKHMKNRHNIIYNKNGPDEEIARLLYEFMACKKSLRDVGVDIYG